MKEGIKVSEEQSAAIERETRDQAPSQKWRSEREWRVTASHFGTVCKATERRDLEKLCASMYRPPNLDSPPIRHGRTYESVALKKFCEVKGKRVNRCGFFVHPDLPYLGASPDGIVEGENAVVEIKCPFSARNSKISPENIKNFSFLERCGDNIRLKRNHDHYYQVIGQLKLAKRIKCYFCVYTFEDLFVEEIFYDDHMFMSTMLPKLKDFYEKEYCPYVVSSLKQK